MSVVGDITVVDFNYQDPPVCLTPTVCIARDAYGPLYNAVEYPNGIVDYITQNEMSMNDFHNNVGSFNNAYFNQGVYTSYGVTFATFRDMDPMYYMQNQYFAMSAPAESRVFEVHIVEWESGEDVVNPGFKFIIIELEPIPIQF